MALLSEAGTFTSPASTGDQTISLDNAIWGGASPKCVIIWSSWVTDTVSTTGSLCFGISDGTNDAALHVITRDSVDTSSADRRHTNAAVLTMVDTDGNTDMEAALSSFGADQFVLNWTVNNWGAGGTYNTLVLGGDDWTEAALVEFSVTNTATQDVAHTLGAAPDGAIFFGTADATNAPNTTTHARMFLGATDFSTDFVSSLTSEDGQGTSDTERLQIASALVQSLNGTKTFDGRITSVDGTNATITWDTQSAGGEDCYALFFRGPQVKVFNDTLSTTVASKNTALGFAGRAGLIASFMGAASASVEADARIAIGGMGQDDGQCSAGAVDEDGQGTTDADRYQDSNEILKILDHTQTVVAAATGSFSGNNLAMNATTADGTAYQFGGLVLGNTAAAAGGLSKIIGGGIIQ